MGKKKILFVASEAVPFVKTGGLADVAGTLPKYFDKERFDVRVIIPKYSCIKWEYVQKFQYKFNIRMSYCGENKYIGIFELVQDGVTFYFLDNEYYFSGWGPYTDDVKWDIEKFIFFSKAALSCLTDIGFRPDVIHCHDWQTGLVPVYLKGVFQDNPFYRGIRSVMTIHNLKFQGIYDKKHIQGVSGLSDYFFGPDKLGLYGDANMLKGGITYADKITTVSNSYAQEIKTGFYGEKLEGLLQAREHDLWGIVNGIDYEQFNPETDPHLEKNYTLKNFRREKKRNKLALQKQLGLTQDPSIMMIGIVSRLTDQKGLDLVAYVLDELCQDAIQLVVLGTGTHQYEAMFRHFAWKYPDKVSANIYYSDELSHKIYGGCDAFLMPSLFEPCGLSQLMSLRYGTLPIVRETGGLRDTVQPFNEYEETGTGFSFRNYNAHEMMATVRYAERIYYDKKILWNRIVDRAMQQDFSWNNSAKQYELLYDQLLGW